MVTTFNAYQKLPRHTHNIFEGNSPWSAFVRVLEPDLSRLAYSSSLTGIWSYDSAGTAIGADNTQLKGVFPTDNGVFVVGRTITDNSVARGNAIPVNNVPAWGASTPDGLTGIFGRLSFATNQNIPPSVSITSPTGPVTIVPGSTLNVTANASDFDGSIDRVEFYVDGALVATDTTAPYGFTWTAPMTQRNYTLMARAYDNEGASTNSPTRTITVYTDNLPPAVSMAAPENNTLIPRGSNIVLSANASDPDGSITKLEFFANGVSLGDGSRANSSQPFSLFWSPAAGIYDITARATDNSGAMSTSLPVKLTVGGVPTGFTVAINFKDSPATDLNQTAAGGYYWNSVGSTQFSKSNLRTLDGVSITDITVDTGDNPFGFVTNTRGSNMETSHNGYVFPAAVTYSYAGDNWASADRNGNATVRLVSDTSYTYNLTILSSRALNADQGWVTDFNVGGTYERTTNITGRYLGGTTLTLDSAAAPEFWSAGTMGPFNTEPVGGQQVFVLNVGANYRAAHINALIVEAVPAYSNTAPVANAGEDFSVTDPNNDGFADVTLDGSQSYDPDEGDSIFSYHWFIDEVEVATGAAPTLTLPVGTTVITLVVLDEFFYEHADTVSVTVLPSPGVPPVPVVATNSPGQDMDSDGFGIVTLDGSASYDPDSGDSIVSWKWQKNGIVLAEGPVVDVNLPVGTHTLSLEVTDNWNKRASTDFQVTVLASPGVPPVAVPPADFAIENSEDKGSMPVPLDGSASYDPDGDEIVRYQWKIGNSVIATGAQVAPILPVGTHTITLVVTDSWNMKGSADVVVTVYRPALVAPVAHAGLNQMIRDDNDSGSVLVQLDGSQSYDPLGPIGIISYTWRINGEVVASAVKPTLQLEVGVHEIELTVVDDDNLSDTDVVTISVLPALTGSKTIIGIAGNNPNTDDRNQGGIYWNGFNLSTTTLPLRDSTNQLSVKFVMF